MKRTSIVVKAIQLASLLPFTLPANAQAVTTNVHSDSTWTVSDTNGNYLGNAQNVCLNATAPSNCPAAATLYGYSASRLDRRLIQHSGCDVDLGSEYHRHNISRG